MTLSLQDVEKIAALARLDLTAAEKALYQEQLSAVLEYARRLEELDIAEVAPTSSAVALRNVMRPDVVQPSLPPDDALYNASRRAQDQFHIQPVFDEG
jgi:aspartyl-tRNA(Asn)/glutamyl-tRNA(Gln) amidotransferase subunit C